MVVSQQRDRKGPIEILGHLLFLVSSILTSFCQDKPNNEGDREGSDQERDRSGHVHQTTYTPIENNEAVQELSLMAMSRSESQILSSPCLKSFSLEELSKATSEFSEASLVGEGRLGRVYKGWLDVETLKPARPTSGLPVAIKKLINDGTQGQNEWLAEVNYLGQLRHPNLVKLIGYCLDGEDRLLVYEFMPQGSLETHLFRTSCSSLSWERRIRVATGAARGLCFIHQSNSNPPFIYGDFKTSDILLDSDFNAKLSDFGLARPRPILNRSEYKFYIVRGTVELGYYCPHDLHSGRLTVKSDVYSFGVLLLELLTGRRVIDETKCEEERHLVDWVSHLAEPEITITPIMDTNLEGQYGRKSAFIAAAIALRCTNPLPKYRPPMTYILEILEILPRKTTSPQGILL